MLVFLKIYTCILRLGPTNLENNYVETLKNFHVI